MKPPPKNLLTQYLSVCEEHARQCYARHICPVDDTSLVMSEADGMFVAVCPKCHLKIQTKIGSKLHQYFLAEPKPEKKASMFAEAGELLDFAAGGYP